MMDEKNLDPKRPLLLQRPEAARTLDNEKSTKAMAALNAHLQAHDPHLRAWTGVLGTIYISYDSFTLLNLFRSEQQSHFEVVDFAADSVNVKDRLRVAAEEVRRTQEYLAYPQLTAEQIQLAETYLAKAEAECEHLRAQADLVQHHEADLKRVQHEWAMRLTIEYGYRQHIPPEK